MELTHKPRALAAILVCFFGLAVIAQLQGQTGIFPTTVHRGGSDADKASPDVLWWSEYTRSDESVSDFCSQRGCLPGEYIRCRWLEKIKSRFGLSSSDSDLAEDDPDEAGPELSPTEWHWRIWNRLDRACKHPLCAYPHLFVPFEVYGRMSVVWLVGGGKLDSHLDPGIGAEIGIRNFLYDETKPAAWFGELGFEYNYYNGQADEDVPFVSIREVDIYWVRVGIGREWYLGSGRPGHWTIVLGTFAGGRFGSANTKFLTEPFRTDNIGGIYAGGHAGFLIPRCGFDIMAEIFTEYGHDWISWSDILDDSDRHLDHIKLGGAVGVRY